MLFVVLELKRKIFDGCSGFRGIEELPPVEHPEVVCNLFEK
jgi:hypothetical protein